VQNIKDNKDYMTRTEIINSLIQKYNYKSYLEIGVNTPLQPGYNWIGIKIQTKHGVDPNVETTFQMTSDEFFEKHIAQKYDIIFVDGLHIFEQVYKDIINSLKYLNDNGTIIVHDCNPMDEITQRRVRASDAWHGDVWKAILKLRIEEKNLEVFTVNTDEGCGIIRKGSQELLVVDKDINIYDFSYLERNRENVLNLISITSFKQKFL
jgi:hypothetical protein